MKNIFTTVDFEYLISAKSELKNFPKGEYVDDWGIICYGNDKCGVEYNYSVDYTTQHIIFQSAFYPYSENDNGITLTDCDKWEEYIIDFDDAFWLEKLLNAAIEAYNKFWEE